VINKTSSASNIDITYTYIKINRVFYYLILVLDGYSRYLVGC
jgi:hypothetical protein